MELNSDSIYPEGVTSFLDTDLYKLTMQCAVMKFFPNTHVTYAFTNRTPEKKLSREAFEWLDKQVKKLGNVRLSEEEYRYLDKHCEFFDAPYLEFLKNFYLTPRDQVKLTFTPMPGAKGESSDLGDLHVAVEGNWAHTILYEIPILSLTSEAYFRFMDKDWNHDGQERKAFDKGMRLLEAGCVFSEFGTRRRRDYHTQALVIKGLINASKEAKKKGYPGTLSGTSNVHLAMRFQIPPVGTVAHEWFMGIAAIKDDYRTATEEALKHWVGAFGGKLSIALTDTFGTREFLRAFSRPVSPVEGGASVEHFRGPDGKMKSYAQIFGGVRQDSGDPADYVRMVREYYDEEGITDKKTIVFSDSLDIDKCLKYKDLSEKDGFNPTFGVGTFLSNDFTHLSTGKKSTPLNIVLKLSSANSRPAVKISDNVGKNTGDEATVKRVKEEVGYVEKDWAEGDESARWGRENQ